MKKIYLLFNLILIIFFQVLCSNSETSRDNPDDPANIIISLNKTTTTLLVGGTEPLTPTISTKGMTSQKGPAWTSSNMAVATVNSNGIITAISAGSTTITVTMPDAGKTAVCYVTVSNTPVSVSGVSLNLTSTVLDTSGSVQLTPPIYPADATNQNVTWTSSNPGVATVSPSGLVTGVSAGSATITVTTADGGKTNACNVIVSSTPVAVTGVSLNKASSGIIPGGTVQLTPTISPYNATSQNLIWTSSDNGIATVSSSGNVYGVSTGSATITATTPDGNCVASSIVSVTGTPVEVTGVTLNKTKTMTNIDGSIQLVETVVPANATDQNIIWTSSNPAVASVSSGGVVTGVSAGSATITATTADGSFFKTCIVTVTKTEVSVSGVGLNLTSSGILTGGTLQLTASVTPANASNQNVTWTSSDNAVAFVSSTGLVYGAAEGSAVITVTTADGVKTAGCNVTVTEAPVSVTGVTLNKTASTIIYGGTVQLIPSVMPVDANTKNVIWKSSNNAIAMVGTTGLVYGVSNGSATITVTTAEGNYTENCVVTVLENGNAIKQVFAGLTHSMVLKRNGTLWATGNNNSGQLGDGTTTTISIPVQVMTGVFAVSTGYEYTMILKTDRSLWATGSNHAYFGGYYDLGGWLGDGTGTSKTTPEQIMTDVSAVFCGNYHTMILKTNGTLWATGLNNYGQFGDGTTTNISVPMQVMTGVSAVSCGHAHTMILKTDGTLWATGLNQYGQCGNGTTANITIPVQVMTGVSKVSASGYHTMTLKTDGTLWASGHNDQGQLGDSTNTDKSISVYVMSEVSAVSCGGNHTMILKTDGSLWATGLNTSGQLGDCTVVTNRYTPVLVMTDVSAVSCGDNYSMILKTDGSLWSAGANQNGQFGNGTNSNINSTPVQVFP